MERCWGQLEAWLETNTPECASHLRPPAAQAAIDDAETELGVVFPPSVRRSYRFHDGEDATSCEVLGHRLLPLAEVVERATTLRDIDADFDYDFWGDSLIPLLRVVNGDYLCVSDASDGVETALLRWDHEQSRRDILEPSFAAYVDTVFETYRAGDYSYDPDREKLRPDISV
jgi:cell wall assembly regulator SMI1